MTSLQLLFFFFFGFLSVCFGPVRSESLGPPPGSAGTIDFRYPDIIVDPIPPCPEEGVFPHPNNCTWYYRCYASFVAGFFHRAYFHCEPGTVFSDGLDQCIWGSSVDGCAGGSSNTIVPKPPVIVVPQPPTPITPPPCTSCLNAVTKCKLYTFCPQSPSIQVTMELCEEANKVCHPCNLSEVLCSGRFFNPTDKRCYSSPSDPSVACDPPIPPTPIEPPCDDCYVSTSRCKPYTVCPSGKEEVTMTLCPNAKNVCLPCGDEEDVCNPEEYFSMEDSKCYPDPVSSAMSCTPPPTTPPPVAGGSVIISASSQNPIDCSVDNLIPSNDWIKKEFCTSRPLCSGGTFTGMSNLCSNYYQCVPKDEGGWEATKMQCPPGMMYSFNENNCMAQPTENAYCVGK